MKTQRVCCFLQIINHLCTSISRILILIYSFRGDSLPFKDHCQYKSERHRTAIFSQAIHQCICAEARYGALTNYMNTMTFSIELEHEDIQEVKEKTYPTIRGRSKLGLKGIRIVYAMEYTIKARIRLLPL